MLPKSTGSVDAIEGFSYRVLENGVYELTLSPSKNPQKALNTFFDQLEKLFPPDPTHSAYHIMVIFDKNFPPINQLMPRAREFRDQHAKWPPTRTAILATPDPLMQLMNTMQGLLRFDVRRNAFRIFRQDQYAEALAWLLADAAAPDGTSL